MHVSYGAGGWRHPLATRRLCDWHLVASNLDHFPRRIPILKKDAKYGLYITGFKVKGNGFFIPNIFDNIPLVDQFDYVKKGFHIIGLYDAQGQFLHYANNQGFIYAK